MTADDPPPLMSGMTAVELDHQGRLTFFERIPPQRHDAPTPPAAVDWNSLFALARLDAAQFQKVEPLWNWLAASDTRAAWTGVWPESGRPLRIEAAALGGRPVAFMLVGPWRTPWRTVQDSPDRENTAIIILFALVISILGAGGWLARKNLREGRGDRSGASRLAVAMATVLMGLWLCQVHLAASMGLVAMFLLAVCTSVFYGVLLWTLYIAVEPFVRRHWPQVLVSLTNLLTGRARDPVVGRDVLIGAALGVAWVLMIRGVDLLLASDGFVNFTGDMDLLTGLRSTVAAVLRGVPYAIRNVLLYFFLLFVLRVFLHSEWAAALAFAAGFGLLTAVSNNEDRWLSAALTFLYFGSGAFVVLRWGLLAFAVALFMTELLMDVPATLDSSAWFFGNMLLLMAIAVGLAGWALYTSVARVRQPVRKLDAEYR